MHENEDQVIISDNHVCPHSSQTFPQTQKNLFKKAQTSHRRSLSLPFLNKNSLSNREKVSSRTPALLEHPLQMLSFSHKGASDGNIVESLRTAVKTEAVKLETMKSFRAENVSDSDPSIPSEDKEVEIVLPTMSALHANSSKAIKKQQNFPKSCSLPVDLWKNATYESEEYFSYSPVEFPDDSSTLSSTPPGSRRSSLLFLDEADSKSGMPISDVGMNIDAQAALSYLNKFTPEHGTPHSAVKTGSKKSTKQDISGKKKSISEMITKSITDNQLLSPITTYSKNVFTGVMDQIEWLKSSTYEKGVAPIKELWSGKENTSDVAKEQETESVENSSFTGEVFSDQNFTFTNELSSSQVEHPLDLESEKKPLADQQVLQDDEALTLLTEVWVWGENKHGELGLADHMDRFQPTCIKSLTSKGIVKIKCGKSHTVALTSNAEIFTWGDNAFGQLGHNEATNNTPVKVDCKHRIWDVAAGHYHSLVLVDGHGQHPVILSSGNVQVKDQNHPLASSAETKKTDAWKLKPVQFRHWSVFHSALVGGFSSLSACLADENCSASTVILHEFAKSERQFYQQMTLIKTDILQPLKFSDLYKVFDHTKYGELLSKTVEAYGLLCYNVGLNTVHLTQSVVLHKDFSKNTFTYVAKELMASFQSYFNCLNNMIAYGFFEKCDGNSKQCKILSQDKFFEVYKNLLGPKRISKLLSENILQIFQLPGFRLREYAAILSKLAISVEEEYSLASLVESISTRWEVLWTNLNTQLQSANNTRGFWKNEFKMTGGSKLAESLKKVGRYLIMHSKKVPLEIDHAGRFSLNWLILFTDCIIVAQYNTHAAYPLETLWCSPVTDKANSRSIKFTAPEEDIQATAVTEEAKFTWLNALYRAINTVLSRKTGEITPMHVLSQNLQLHRPPPASRYAEYTFQKNLTAKNGTYVGSWLNGKPHGKGEMTWKNGSSYKGSFKDGLEEGYGELTHSPHSTSILKYHGWWKEGKMNGHGKVWYSSYQHYEGQFLDDMRQGHGVFRSGSVTEGTVYVGSWSKDVRSGYGVEDNISKGEKYLGMWEGDKRHGVGMLVTLDGLYCQGRFTNGDVTGEALLIDGRHILEGHVGPGLVLNGKGRLTLPNGDKLEGTFTGPWGRNFRVAGNLVRVDMQQSSEEPTSPTEIPFSRSNSFVQKDLSKVILRRYNRHIMKKGTESKNGKLFPLTLHPDLKWLHLFEHCRKTLQCSSEDTVEVQKVWEAISVAITNAKQRQEILQSKRSSPLKKPSATLLRCLEQIPSIVKLRKNETRPDEGKKITHAELACIREYLQHAFGTKLHPIGELADSLGNVFRDSYSGAGAHKCLLTQAIADVRSFVRSTYSILRCMFPQLCKEHDSTHMKVLHQCKPNNVEDGANSLGEEFDALHVTAGDLLLPVLLPRVYPTLFTLYALRQEAEDQTYWERVNRLNRHPDVALLSFLGVKPKFWLIEESEMLLSMEDECDSMDEEENLASNKWRHLFVARASNCSFLSAIETLQLISTTFIPAEKLNVIHSAFKEINATVVKHLGSVHTWSMDDLFPVFQYVVVRSRICHLGCEIQLVEDFLEPDMCKGEKGIMFTTLKACYFQIRLEKDI